MNARTKTTLEALIEAGLLQEGERLYASIVDRHHRPGYARRNGRVADVRSLSGDSVAIRSHTRSGYTATWPLDGLTELLEFGSFNPANDNYQPGGRPWQPKLAKEFEAELTGDGKLRIVSDGGDGSLNGRVGSASAAITLLYGRPDGGWKNWKVERAGQRVTLEAIRNEFDLRQQKPSLEALDQPAPELVAQTATPAEIAPDVGA